MLRITLIIQLIFFSFQVLSQDDYVLRSGYKTYENLETFESCYGDYPPIINLNSCEFEIELGFEVPFFNDVIDRVFILPNSVGGFPNSEDFNFFMFDGEYQDPGAGTLDTQSDFRYYIERNGPSPFLCVEWVNVALFDEILKDGASTNSFNFQVIIYENGIFEAHFGEMRLENPNRFDSENGFVDAYGEFSGPGIEILSLDGNENYYITGNEDSPEINYSNAQDFETFGSIPSKGWYIQFVPKQLVSSSTVSSDLENIEAIPNPTSNILVFRNLELGLSTQCRIFSLDGQLVRVQTLTQNSINVGSLDTGIYIIELVNSEGVFKTKVVKQ